MVEYKNCPECKLKMGVRNGHRRRTKYGQKQNYKCQSCGRQFVEKQETLTRTEKRLFSLLYNLICYPVNKDDKLKTFVKACNVEVPLIGKLDFKVTYKDIDLSNIKDVALVICSNGRDIKIIKTSDECQNSNTEELSDERQDSMPKELNDEPRCITLKKMSENLNNVLNN